MAFVSSSECYNLGKVGDIMKVFLLIAAGAVLGIALLVLFASIFFDRIVNKEIEEAYGNTELPKNHQL